MFFTADQLVAHAVGDFLLQSHWMATQKTKQSFAAAVHAFTYTLPFLMLTSSVAALSVICGTHFLIDRFRLARYVVWLKNGPWTFSYAPGLSLDGDMTWERKPLTATGFSDDTPAWLSVWLLIIVDNILHVCINAAALRWL